jgi:ankyrin repeat protein
MDLINAIINDDLLQVKQLLEKGAEANISDDDANVTPLHYAVLHNKVSIAELLITAGANLNARSNEDQTPLELAQELGHKEMIALLKKLSPLG